jgi:hypothetical protein
MPLLSVIIHLSINRRILVRLKQFLKLYKLFVSYVFGIKYLFYVEAISINEVFTYFNFHVSTYKIIYSIEYVSVADVEF